MDTDDSKNNTEKEKTIFIISTFSSLTWRYSFASLLYIWDDYLVINF